MWVRKADDDALMNAKTVTLCQLLPRGEMDEWARKQAMRVILVRGGRLRASK